LTKNAGENKPVAGENKAEFYLAFFSVVASGSNLSTYFSLQR